MKQGTLLGGQATAWSYGALVKGRTFFAEALDIDALSEALRELDTETGGPFVIVVPVDGAEDAEELTLVAGVPLAIAVVDDNSEDEVTVEVTAEAMREAFARSLPVGFWGRLAEAAGLELEEADGDAVFLAPGGWSSATLRIGERTLKAFSENDPPPVRVDMDAPATVRLTATYA